MNGVKGIPYGVASFTEIITQNFYFVDKSMYFPELEDTAKYLFLIRPRRFGKSVFLSMMSAYYDVNMEDEFDTLFGNLWIGSHPTKLKNGFQVMYFDFSKAGASVSGQDLMDSFNEYCCIRINNFAERYARFYKPEFVSEVKKIPNAKAKLSYIETEAKDNHSPLYLIIDEYDNFTNVVLSEQGKDVFEELTHKSGFYREYFKQFKGMFDRIFMMGVSPVTLDDVTSGYNIDWGISSDPRFNAMLGFDEADVHTMFQYYQEQGKLQGDVDQMIEEMRPWYDNYCFAEDCLDNPKIFNCDMTFYYLKNQILYHHAPKEMVDKNIRTDYSKLKMFVRLDKATGSTERMSTLQEIEAKGYLYTNIKTSFPADKIANPENYNSLLFYYGLLTIGAVRGDMLKMVIPNNCVREQYFGFMREYYREYTQEELGNLVELMTDMAFDGEWQPFIKKIANAYRDVSSVRDSIRGEQNLQGFFKAYLSLTSYFLVQPELEMNYGYCDFFLIGDKKKYEEISHSFILELKYSKPTATAEELAAQAEEGKAQLCRYAQDKVAQRLAAPTTMHLILLQFKGSDVVACEEI
jgi:hypothetical protein